MKLLKFDTIDSTNTFGKIHFSELEDKTAICADEQTCGRGRFERVWVSKKCENIYLSIILKPQNTLHIANLTQYLCVVAAKELETYKVTPQIKWPNDVLVNNKKICGILCESVLKNNKIQGVVLGIGINLNTDYETIKNIDRPATSLNFEIGAAVNKNEFLNNLLEKFFEGYDEFVEKGFPCIKKDYLKYENFLEKQIFICQKDGDEKIPYFSKYIDDKGNLVVSDNNNEEKIIYSGDLIL